MIYNTFKDCHQLHVDLQPAMCLYCSGHKRSALNLLYLDLAPYLYIDSKINLYNFHFSENSPQAGATAAYF